MKKFIGKVKTTCSGFDFNFKFKADIEATGIEATDAEIKKIATAVESMFDDFEWSYEEVEPNKD